MFVLFFLSIPFPHSLLGLLLRSLCTELFGASPGGGCRTSIWNWTGSPLLQRTWTVTESQAHEFNVAREGVPPGSEILSGTRKMSEIPSQIASSLADIGQILGSIQSELRELKLENQTLRAEVDHLKTTPFSGNPGTFSAKTPPFGILGEQRSGSFESDPNTRPLQISVASPVAVPLAPPERFSGDSSKFSIFLNQCQLQFLCRPAAFPDDSAKVAFILSYLVGNAAQWSIPLVEGDDPILYSYPSFKEALRKMFAKHSYMQAIDNELLGLRQGNRDLLTYLSTFKRLVTETKWPEDKRGSLFYRGLSEELKDALSQIVDPPEDWEELIDLVVKIDHRLNERKGERIKNSRIVVFKSDKKSPESKPSEDTPEPMQIGGLRSPLSKEEKDKRRRQNLCLYCGKPGHFAKECPVKPKVKRTVAMVQEGEQFVQEN